MRSSRFIVSLLLLTVATFATSYLLTLERKVALSKIIARVSVTSTTQAGCSARVLEVLKGPTDLKVIDFHFAPYGDYSVDKLPSMVGHEYYVFLHELDGWYWVLEGPAGIRPLADHYEERRVSDSREVIKETYTRSNFVARIRSLALQADPKKP